ncbi:MAG: PQQ-dependent sugar dehydrogenase [Anaerolineae bacterium]|nr:PQQ-dependent sugar dehydrogenase [Anaerolineae bacterium]
MKHRSRRAARAGLWTLLALMIVMAMPLAAGAAPDAEESLPPMSSPDDTIVLTRIAGGLSRPVYVTYAPGDRSRLFIIEKLGRIRVVENGTLLATPFLDISGPVNSSGNEQGLLSMAFDPDYQQNGTFYVSYTGGSGAGYSVIARYQVTADPNVADPNSAQTVLTLTQPYTNHNGGQINFDPDGYLRIGFGDGGLSDDPSNAGQRLDTWLAKILRIDVSGVATYTVPADNPFVGVSSALPEIWDQGLRNPWRWSFDRLTGDLWIGDVGQNAWEEVDYEPAGSAGGVNYGWRCKEGTHNYIWQAQCEGVPFVDPVTEYSHSDGYSVTGGYVYRGSPNSPWFGTYFFWDYGRPQQIRTLIYNGASWVRTDHTPDTGSYTLNRPTSLGEDFYGNLYVADDNYTDPNGGEVYRLELAPATCVSGNFDVNGDGTVSTLDIQLVAGDWYRTDYDPDYDVNCDGVVDILDIQETAAAWTG